MEIAFHGPFTADEFRELLQTLRNIEQRDPSRHFDIRGNFEEFSTDEIMDVLRSVEPPYPAGAWPLNRPAGKVFDERE